MIDRAAFVPHPPALLPGATGGRIAEVERLRSVAAAAVEWVVDAAPDVVVLLGSAPTTREWGPAGRPGTADLPLSLDVASRLCPPEHFGSAGAARPVLLSVATDASAADCRTAGNAICVRGARVGLVVAGDASARRSATGPGYLDPRARAFDAEVLAALAAGDAVRLAGLDTELGDALLAAGPRVWRTAAAAVHCAGADLQVDADIDYADAPFGVCYLVARWAVRRAGSPGTTPGPVGGS